MTHTIMVAGWRDGVILTIVGKLQFGRIVKKIGLPARFSLLDPTSYYSLIKLDLPGLVS